MEGKMVKTGDIKKWLGIMAMVLAVLVVGITATGYADPLGPTEQLSGPALVGSLEVIGSADSAEVTVIFNGHCRGDKTAQFPAGANATLPTILGSLTAANLQGLPLPGVGLSACPGKNDQPLPSNNLIVKAVMPSKFMNTGTMVTAEVVLLFVVTP
jgi:hypothetical protein